ncbi:MAG TPA: S1 family peptidase, partial [Nannocystis sp.]
MRPAAYVTSLSVVLTLSSPAAAAEDPPPIAGPADDPSAIYGGEVSAVCGWPTTVSMEGACTGTLVHPEVVIYAAHCGLGYKTITFGESIQGPKRQVPTQFCRVFPGGGPGNGKDFAFCKLAQPQTDIPIVPIMLGCETEYLKPGQPVTVVGFGNANNGPYGIKREVVTTINGITPQGEAFIGGGGKDSCQGDSGGPVFLQLDDGTWRVFGITSYGGACGTGGYYSMMHNGIQWFEQESGVDLTPCWDASTNPPTWSPTPECRDFPLDPGVGGFNWASGCAGGPLGQSMSCGPLLCQTDEVAPTVQVVAPANDTELSSPNQTDNVLVTVSIAAADEPMDCYVKEVRLLINGNEVGGTDKTEPYEFVDVSFPTGIWQVSARAIDY